MSELRVLAAYGHPDDEGQVTGTLARLIGGGARVTLVCGTRGEVGEISDPALATPETLGYVRELELRAAMAQIGLSDVRFLPFRDSGMAGWEINQDPRCLNAQPAEQVVEMLVREMRDVRPHVVFTWDPNGGYGHPDHIAMHRHILAAFDACGDASQFPDAGPAWSPRELYWGALGMKRFAGMFLEMQARGLLTEPLDPERQSRFEEAMAAPDPVVSLIVPVLDVAAQKKRAAAMHRSQFGENSMMARIPDDLARRFNAEERFFRARPEWPDGAPPVTGLDGLWALAD